MAGLVIFFARCFGQQRGNALGLRVRVRNARAVECAASQGGQLLLQCPGCVIVRRSKRRIAQISKVLLKGGITHCARLTFLQMGRLLPPCGWISPGAAAGSMGGLTGATGFFSLTLQAGLRLVVRVEIADGWLLSGVGLLFFSCFHLRLPLCLRFWLC